MQSEERCDKRTPQENDSGSWRCDIHSSLIVAWGFKVPFARLSVRPQPLNKRWLIHRGRGCSSPLLVLAGMSSTQQSSGPSGIELPALGRVWNDGGRREPISCESKPRTEESVAAPGRWKGPESARIVYSDRLLTFSRDLLSLSTTRGSTGPAPADDKTRAELESERNSGLYNRLDDDLGDRKPS